MRELGISLLTLAAQRFLAGRPRTQAAAAVEKAAVGDVALPATAAAPAAGAPAGEPTIVTAPATEVGRPLDIIAAFAIGAVTSAWLGKVFGGKKKAKKRP